MSIAAKFATAVAAAAMLSIATPAVAGQAAIEAPAVTELKAGTLLYWSAGEFTRNGQPIDAPQVSATIRKPLAIMTHQVTAAEYKRCVDDKACAAAGGEATGDVPVVMVSWRDAKTYASWLSRKLGENYRLPTDEEWTYAAGNRAPQEARLGDADAVVRWVDRYNREAQEQPADAAPQPVGHFGANENGLVDIAGNVWEWTDSCYTRTVLDAAGKAVGRPIVNCGVRIAEGRHRAYVTDFVRDARAGGCAAGIPPANLGFRLVRDSASIWRLF